MQNTSTVQHNFALRLGDQIGPNDKKYVWFYNIPIISSSQKKVLLAIDAGQITFKGLSELAYAQQFFLCADTVQGFSNQSGNPTGKLAIFRVFQITSYARDTVIYHNIIYRLSQPKVWDIGSSRTLRFFVVSDNDIVEPPFGPLLSVQFRLIHILIN